MITGTHFFNLFFLLFVVCVACVPLQQQTSESEDEEIEGFIGPLIIDIEEFNHVASTRIYGSEEQLPPSNTNAAYKGTFGGKSVYIRNCHCLKDAKIIQNKLVVIHSYGGGESNRESTKLLWNGEYYQNSKGEDVVDIVLYSNKIDLRRALLQEKKILDVTAVQVKGKDVVWINLVGYDQLIRYAY